jgi:hypothetical protein
MDLQMFNTPFIDISFVDKQTLLQRSSFCMGSGTPHINMWLKHKLNLAIITKNARLLYAWLRPRYTQPLADGAASI